VKPWNPAKREGTGFAFDHFTPEGLRWALDRALETRRDSAAWTLLQRNGMAQDFSWSKQVVPYERLYARLARLKR
jgi:starch synthase